MVKLQHKMMTTRQRWRGKYDFCLIGHEHLCAFKKAEKHEKISRLRMSMGQE